MIQNYAVVEAGIVWHEVGDLCETILRTHYCWIQMKPIKLVIYS